MDAHNSKVHGGFWEAYKGYAEENRVPPDRLPFFTRKNSPENYMVGTP